MEGASAYEIGAGLGVEPPYSGGCRRIAENMIGFFRGLLDRKSPAECRNLGSGVRVRPGSLDRDRGSKQHVGIYRCRNSDMLGRGR